MYSCSQLMQAHTVFKVGGMICQYRNGTHNPYFLFELSTVVCSTMLFLIMAYTVSFPLTIQHERVHRVVRAR